MEKKYLIVNIGSVSKKYALYEADKELCRVYLEKNGSEYMSFVFVDGRKEEEPVTSDKFEKALEYLLEIFKARGFVADKTEISAIGVRVVAQGAFFQQNRIVDDEYMKKLEEDKEEVPIHVGKVLTELAYLKEIFVGIKIVGVSDSVFHNSMPSSSNTYGLPQDVVEKYELKRYGYHGISIQSIINKLSTKGAVPNRLIVCHLGGGASVTAIRDGKSLDTSMGFSPAEGLMTATRVGNIDPVAVLYLSQKLGKSVADMQSYLNKESGLLGVSGKTSDIRDLIEFERRGEASAKLALELFTYGIRKYIGAYMAALGGADMVVFSGTIGERSSIIRGRVLSSLEDLGIKIDQKKNNATDSSDTVISTWRSKVKVMVMNTDEVAEIARQTRVLL